MMKPEETPELSNDHLGRQVNRSGKFLLFAVSNPSLRSNLRLSSDVAVNFRENKAAGTSYQMLRPKVGGVISYE
jgi:hypothetical protein